jgi:THO complex subunit 4
VTYTDPLDAELAVREFDGANANGQPIKLTVVAGGQQGKPARNPFDHVEKPARSLFDRVDESARRRRVDSEDERPSRPERRSDVTKPAPEHIDRYVPGQEGGRRRSPIRGRGQRGGRRAGQRQPRDGRDTEGHAVVGGRPRKTVEELDAEMNDYWGGGTSSEAQNQNGVPQAGDPPADATAQLPNDDTDMIM